MYTETFTHHIIWQNIYFNRFTAKECILLVPFPSDSCSQMNFSEPEMFTGRCSLHTRMEKKYKKWEALLQGCHMISLGQERVNDLSTNEKFDWPVKLKACIGHTVLVLQGGYWFRSVIHLFLFLTFHTEDRVQTQKEEARQGKLGWEEEGGGGSKEGEQERQAVTERQI